MFYVCWERFDVYEDRDIIFVTQDEGIAARWCAEDPLVREYETVESR